MAISSITSPIGIQSSGTAHNTNSSLTGCPSPSVSAHSDTISPHSTGSKSGSSSPTSHSFFNYSTSSISSSSSSPNTLKHKSGQEMHLSQTSNYYHPYHHCGSLREAISETKNGNVNINPATPSLSLHERRLRNKTASAKYRAKKNQQYGEMRSMISSLTKENELLLRQLDHVQHENGHLKATCDRLRGKIMAQKMLKQYLVDSEQQSLVVNPTPMDSNCFMHYHAVPNMAHRKYPELNDKGNWDKRD